MRISTNYQYSAFQSDISSAQQALFESSAQVSSGKRINRPSDDPFGTVRSVTMRSLQAGIKQYQDNLNTAKGQLGFGESTLSEMSTLTNRAYTLAVSGANGATDQKGRDAMAAEIAQIQSRLIDLANTKDSSGGYLFAGQKADVKPYTLAGTTLTYNGDSNSLKAEVGPGDMMTISTAGEPLISDLYNRLQSLKDNLTGGTVSAISGTDIANIQNSLDAISDLRGGIGSKLKTIDDLSSQMTRRSDDLTTSISDVEDVDITEAMVKYQQANQAYSAALTVASQGFRLSLMDFIQG